MSIQVKYVKKQFEFIKPAGTSRGVYTNKNSYFIIIEDFDNNIFGIGEAAPLVGLSIDDRADFENVLEQIILEFNAIDIEIFDFNYDIILNQMVPSSFPSIRFGFETAMLDLIGGGKRILFESNFINNHKPLAINGLIWMNTTETMFDEAVLKYNSGFKTLKFKVGALDFEEELALIQRVRLTFGSDIEIRLDANGGFTETDCLDKLEKLSKFNIHSIEQPIKAKQLPQMKEIILHSPIKIALDEELIGIADYFEKQKLLKYLQPNFIILKPTLLAGLNHCKEWIEIAERNKIGWWMTSALESNIGLNAIAQFTASFATNMPQGLGTGSLYKENFQAPFSINNGEMIFDPTLEWDLLDILK